MTDILERIRQQCAWVAEQAVHVRLCEDRIPAFASTLAGASAAPPEIDRVHHYVEPALDPAGTVAFFLTLDSVNFGSGYFPFLRKRPGRSGYFTIAGALADRFRAQGPLSADVLASCGVEDCARIFEQDLDVPEMAELMSLFAQAFRDLGQDLVTRYHGDVLALIEDAEGSAARLIGILDRQPFFHDVAEYQGIDVPLYKRAQITASDLALAFDRQGPGAFADLNRLTLFADNLVPHVLRVEGILAYEADLLRRIESGERLPSGSPEEIELRACAVHAVERIVDALQSQGRPTTARDLDLILWNHGQDPAIKGAGPRHRTRCVYY